MHTEAPDRAIPGFCLALMPHKNRIPWETSGRETLPLDQMYHDTANEPLDVPLHPAAERFWREKGYLA